MLHAMFECWVVQDRAEQAESEIESLKQRSLDLQTQLQEMLKSLAVNQLFIPLDFYVTANIGEEERDTVSGSSKARLGE